MTPRPQGLLPLLSASFAEHASRPALTGHAETVTYQQLLEWSAVIEDLLVAEGARVGDRIALALRDRVHHAVCVLACLRRGFVFVPVDATMNINDRIRWTVRACRARAVVTDAVDVAPWAELAPVVRFTRGATSPRAAEQLPPDHPAYVYFTSGSTGTPKGIVGQLRGLSHFVRWEADTLGLDAGVRVTQFTHPVFDASLRDLLVPWSAGGTVLVPARSPFELGGEGVVEWLESVSAQLVHCVPSVFRMMLRAGLHGERLPTVRWVVMAGETLHVKDVAAWHAVFGGRVALVNLYGATETTMVKFHHRVEPTDVERGFIPIGRPMRGAAALIVDEMMQPVPDGVVGEIIIRSPYMTLGYLDDAVRTDASFPRLFGEPPGHVYRTGDLGRVLPDGTFQLLGRRDDMVKLGGVRIELGEVTVALRRVPGVADAAVRAFDLDTDSPLLVGYVVVDPSAPATPEVVTTAVAEWLPPQGVPATVVVLPRLPLTVTGKVDVQKLPRPARATQATDGLGAALRALFADALARPDLDDATSFWAAGGTSLRGAGLVARISKLTGAKLALRDLLDAPTPSAMADLVRRGVGGAGRATLGLSAGPEAPVPLLPGQRELWLVETLRPELAYVVGAAVRVAHGIALDELRVAAVELVRRHEALRSAVEERDGDSWWIPTSDVADVVGRALCAFDADDSLVTACGRVWDELLTVRLSSAVPGAFRLALVRARDGCGLVFVANHVIADAGSLVLLVQDLANIIGGKERRDEERPRMGFGDVARAWHRAKIDDAARARWLEGLGAGTAGGGARASASAATLVHREITWTMSPAALESMQDAVVRAGGTVAGAVCAAAAYAVGRSHRRASALVGLVTSLRGTPGAEAVVGHLVETVPVAVTWSGTTTFDDVVRDASRAALWAVDGALEWGHVAATLGPEAPRPDLLVVVQQDHGTAGSALEALPIRRRKARAQTTFSAASSRDLGLFVTLEFAEPLLDAVAAAALMDDFTRALAAMQSAGASIIAPPSVLRGETPPATHADLVSMVEASFLAHADRTALESADGRVASYRQLRDQTLRGAAALAAAGVGRGDVVAIVGRRGMSFPAAVLAVLFSGAAWLPVDEAHVSERTASGVAAVAVRAVVALGDEALDASAAIAPGARRVDLNSGAGEPPRVAVTGADVAYVILTSGTTGTPKAVAVSHAAVARLVATQVVDFDLDSTARVLQVVSPAFDVYVSEMFTALASGAALVCDVDLVEGRPSTEALAHAQPTMMSVPASVLDAVAVDPPPTLRTLVVGGEPCSPGAGQRWGRGRRLLNCYGPTEATVCATTGFADGSGRVPNIGRPLRGVSAYVLGSDGEPVPRGAAGVLHLAGETLAIGYWGRAAATGASFVPDPHGLPGSRMYDTGDLVFVDDDATLTFLGRADEQVKVRGVRIDLDELDAHLAEAPGLERAMSFVLGRGAAARLGCAVIAAREDVPGWRAWAARRLPPALRPGIWVTVDRFPRSAGGKVDRRALASRIETELGATTRDPPREELEILVAEAMARVLGVPTVGRAESFFDLGGHSLTAMKLSAELGLRLGTTVPVSAIIESQEPHRLAAALARGAAELPLVMLARGPGVPLLFVHALGGDAAPYVSLARHLEGEAPVVCARSPLLSAPTSAATTIGDLARTHVEHWEKRHSEPPRAVVGWSFGALIASEIVRHWAEKGVAVPFAAVDPTIGHLTRSSAPSWDELAAEVGELHPPDRPAPTSREALVEALVARGVDADAAGRRLDAMDAHARAAMAYGRPLVLPDLLLIATAPGSTRADEVASVWARRLEAQRTVTLPADHHAIVGALAGQTAAALLQWLKGKETAS